jgi:hypothetical protein
MDENHRALYQALRLKYEDKKAKYKNIKDFQAKEVELRDDLEKNKTGWDNEKK